MSPTDGDPIAGGDGSERDDAGTSRPEDPRRRAERWIAIDPDPVTRLELREIVGSATDDPTAERRLAELCGGRLDFGTAGLRGARGPGPRRMNRLVVRQTAAGLADVLSERPGGSEAGPVLVGFDARHLSDVFARDVAAVLGAAGIRAILTPGARPTPFVAWTMRQIGAIGAVVVTASHNPAADSGLKIYDADGAQIVPPVDERIRRCIDAHAHHDPPGSIEGTAVLDEEWDDRFIDVASRAGPSPPPDTPTRVAFTALHGVGADFLRRSLTMAGVTEIIDVAEQRDPDPDFPTVSSPNPEEPGATDALLELAERSGADLALALDPDADRLAAGCRTSDEWMMLNGDQLGALLCEGLLRARPDRSPPALVVSTVVSSRLAGRIAVARGARFAETLTGFKWLCRPGLADPDVDLVLAYEEAMGYAVDGLLDKDAISAAVALTSLHRRWAAEGRHVLDVLDALAVEFGAHVQLNTSVTRPDLPGGPDGASSSPELFHDPPRHLAGYEVSRVDRPARDVLRLWVGDDDRVAVRPSGTENKLKVYCEAVEPVGAGEDPARARHRARHRLESIHSFLTRDVLHIA